jgi:hypothetical protein
VENGYVEVSIWTSWFCIIKAVTHHGIAHFYFFEDVENMSRPFFIMAHCGYSAIN